MRAFLSNSFDAITKLCFTAFAVVLTGFFVHGVVVLFKMGWNIL